MREQLKMHILKFATPSEKEVQSFLKTFEIENILNKEYLLKEGQY